MRLVSCLLPVKASLKLHFKSNIKIHKANTTEKDLMRNMGFLTDKGFSFLSNNCFGDFFRKVKRKHYRYLSTSNVTSDNLLFKQFKTKKDIKIVQFIYHLLTALYHCFCLL